ncbi:hypothetical protein KAR91_16415 [Candidatus Pacearchaeota archaeon]|nr:hypothetical protein [Candidatus Pacearchaeota archaeon]
MKLLKNKRAEGDMLSEETVKLIFSIMSISVLFLLAGSLFYMFVKSSPMRQADAMLEEIIRTSNALDDGEVGRVIFTGPTGWYLLGVDNELCLCEEKSADGCNDKKEGVCKKTDINVLSTVVDYVIIDGILLDDISEILIIKNKESSDVFSGEYEDYNFVGDFLSEEFDFFGRIVSMQDYMMEYVRTGDIDCSDGKNCWRWVATGNDSKEDLMTKYFTEYFSNSDIKYMEVSSDYSIGYGIFTINEGKGFFYDFLGTWSDSYRQSGRRLLIKIGEHDGYDIFVEFSKE